MTTEELPTLPDRDVLRALYDEAVNELNQSRDGRLTTDFYAKTGAAVFEACYLALSDLQGNQRLPKGPCGFCTSRWWQDIVLLRFHDGARSAR
jgi:hypothetical protein